MLSAMGGSLESGTSDRAALYISSLASARGAERVVFHVARELAARGHRLTLLVEETGGRLVDDLAKLPNAPEIVELETLDGPTLLSRVLLLAAVARVLLERPRRLFSADAADLVEAAWKAPAPILGLRRWIRRERPRAVLSFLHDPNLTLALAKRLALGETRCIASVRNHITVSAAKAKSSRMRAVPGAMRMALPGLDRVLAVSEGIRADVLRITELPEDRVEALGNPVDPSDAAAAARVPSPHRWLADGRGPVVVAAGKLKPQKDFPTLLRAFARVESPRPARLVVLGEGDEREALLALAATLGIADRVDLPGQVENPLAFFVRADLFVLSSAWEGLPNVLLEALACGCPVVSTDCPSGPAEILKGSGAGRLVPVGDVAAMARAIERELAQPTPRSLSIACTERYAIGSIVDRYEALLFGKVKARARVPRPTRSLAAGSPGISRAES